MLPKPKECQNCVLYGNGYGFIEPEGKNLSNVYLVGEAGGENEAKQGKPFVKFAQAGSKLEEVFRLTGKKRDDYRIVNIVNCRPPNNKLEFTYYEQPAIEHCRVHLHKTLKPNGNNVILALGNVAMKSLTDFSGEGKEAVSLLRGYIFKSKYGYIIPTYHPSFIKRGKPSYTPYLVYDLNKATKLSSILNQSGREIIHEDGQGRNDEDSEIRRSLKLLDHQPNYNEFPSLDDIKSFYYKVKDNPNLLLSYDIETPYSPELDEDERANLSDKAITQIQFSLEKNQGIAFPFTNDNLVAIKLLMLTSNDKIGHNSYNFDNPRLRANNIKINGVLHDSMFAFKQWNPGLQRNLQSVASLFNFPIPWKHLFTSQLRFYGCCDVDAPQYIFPKLKELMIKDGVWDGYINHVVEFFPIMQSASNRGIPVNDTKRVELKGFLEQERINIDNEIQKLIPNSLKNLSPKIKDKETKEIIRTGYKHTPKAIYEAWENYQLTDQQITFSDFLSKQVVNVRDKFGKLKDRYCLINIPNKLTINNHVEYHGCWHKQHYFKASKEQLVRYIQWKQTSLLASDSRFDNKLAKSYEVPKKYTKKGEPEKYTTGEKAIRELYEKTYDEVIRLIIGDKDIETNILMNKVGIRSIDTNINNYIPNWKPSEDGKVHTQFGFIAASGQLDSRSPNILNCSKHTQIGQLFRGIVEAPKDYLFIEFDFRSFHVATMGYCANDSDYIRFSQLDPHSYFTAYYVRDKDLPLPRFDMTNEEILAICKLYKKKYPEQRQHVSKVVVLGNQLGLGSKKIYLQNKKYFINIKDAQEKQNILNDLFPKVHKFKNKIRELAHQQTKLVNDWGYLQRFFEVFTWKYDTETKSLLRQYGSESEKCLAFPVQSTAFGKLREDLKILDSLGYLEAYNFCNSIHDSILFMPHKNDIEECYWNIKPILESPCKKLLNEATKSTNGLVVGTEAAIGRNWRKYHKENNPDGTKEFELSLQIKKVG